MPTPTKGPRLGGSPAHERLILANLAQSLFEHGKIVTTEAKAKKLRPYAEKLITSAKRGTLHARREVLKTIRNKDVLHKLFAEIGPAFATREGGYTRIIKTAPRKGDNAPMALIELIDEETVSSAASRTTRRAARTRSASGSTPAASRSTPAAGGSTPAAGGSTPAAGGSSPAATGAAVAAVSAPEEAVTSEEDSPTQAEQAVTEAPAEGAAEVADVGVTAEATDVAAQATGETAAATDETHPHGPGSHAPLADGSEPDGFPVKGNADSNLYHLPGTRFYDTTVAEVWFAGAEAAEAAGFLLPPSQREDADDEK